MSDGAAACSSEYPPDGVCQCCSQEVEQRDWDHIYGTCDACAWCLSLGQCYEGEDLPENTICCHGDCR